MTEIENWMKCNLNKRQEIEINSSFIIKWGCNFYFVFFYFHICVKITL